MTPHNVQSTEPDDAPQQHRDFTRLPPEIQALNTFVLWRWISRGTLKKVPFDPDGKGRGNNNPELHLTFAQAEVALKRHPDAGLAIFQPTGGTQVTVNGRAGFLHIFDLDGFVCGGEWLGKKIWEMAGRTYAEISPSGTGAKLLVVSDMSPQPKKVYKLEPGEFYKDRPDIPKYGPSHAVEVFSKGFFNCITGDRWSGETGQLAFIESDRLRRLFDHLASISIDAARSESGIAAMDRADPNQRYGKLTEASLTQKVLPKVDHHGEQNWSDVANALARAYGEAGRNYFLRWSQDGYGQGICPKFDTSSCHARFDRALRETQDRDGYGCPHLIELAGLSGWDATSLSWEEGTVIEFPSLKQTGGDRAPDSKRFTFRTPGDLAQQLPLPWRVKKVLPEAGLAAIFGASGSGKSFLAIDLLGRISLGAEFYGCKTVPCPVVYVCLEGSGGVSNRIAAWEKHNQRTLPDTFRVVTDQLSLFDQDAKLFAEAVKDVGLDDGVIVVDTLNQSAPTADENTSADMGRIIQNAKILQHLTGSLVILVHHSGKDATKGLRGHSSLLAALDTAIEVKRAPAGREWGLSKSKDSDDSVSRAFRLEKIGLGIDADGEPFDSCVAIPDPSRIFQRPPPTGKNQLIALAAIKAHVESSGDRAMGMGTAMECVKAALGGDTKRQATRAKEAINGLVAGSHLEQVGEAIALSSPCTDRIPAPNPIVL